MAYWNLGLILRVPSLALDPKFYHCNIFSLWTGSSGKVGKKLVML